ncbi:MAG: SDR family oxidoreductase, partial [Actinobacteria bacterium]|nr:SDR family oxidoreductase [Actinomycetota bacterium]
VRDSFGPTSILINNAAMIERSSFLDVTIEEFEAVWHTNVRGVFQLSQRVAADMVEQGIPGVIVHISSILARLAVANRTAYIASKGAIEGLTRAMAIDLAPHSIRVNAVAPGLIATEALLAGMPDLDVQAAVQSYIPGRRFGRPEELMAAILFAASPEASYLNGAVLPVDAGLGGREAGPA